MIVSKQFFPVEHYAVTKQAGLLPLPASGHNVLFYQGLCSTSD